RVKRGGGITLVPIDLPEAERELRQQARNPVTDLDAFFQREWLRSLFANAAARLREACAARGRPQRFALFELCDLAEDDGDRPSYAELARRRSEEHTSELQSLTNLVCRLLLE